MGIGGKRRNSLGLTGIEVGERIKRSSGMAGVGFEGVAGKMTDHYDPSSHVVRMSEDVARRPSVAAMAIVAHELGHAQQHEENSAFIAMRSFLLPAMRFSPMLSYVMIFGRCVF